jgi:hypothetical protein
MAHPRSGAHDHLLLKAKRMAVTNVEFLAVQREKQVA